MNGDAQLKNHVEDELGWEPSLDAAAIGVAVNDAIVTLSGYVNNFSQKQAAERAVLRIHGVRALANELEVKLSGDTDRSDEDIARTAASIFLWNASIPEDRIKIEVSHGWVTLEGTVDWHYQKTAAELAIEDLMGVKGVSNQVVVKAAPARLEIKSQIEAALKRDADVDEQGIHVAIQGNTAVLSGTVRTMSQKIAAERAAWRAWGIGWVENELKVFPNPFQGHMVAPKEIVF